MKRIALILVLIVYSRNISFSQNDNIGGVFPTLNIAYKFNDKWKLDSYSFMAINPIAKTNYPAKTSILYTEVDLTYSFTEKFSTTISYTYERVNPFRSDYRNENRAWLQFQLLTPLKKIEIKNRVRYDLRFIEVKNPKATDFRPRFRYLLGVKFDIGEKDKGWSLKVFNEVFLNTYKASDFVFTENWGYLGISKELSEHFSVELGYLNISWIKDAQKNWLVQHYIQPTVTWNIK